MGGLPRLDGGTDRGPEGGLPSGLARLGDGGLGGADALGGGELDGGLGGGGMGIRSKVAKPNHHKRIFNGRFD